MQRTLWRTKICSEEFNELVRLVLPHHDTPANAEEALILYKDIIRNIEDL